MKRIKLTAPAITTRAEAEDIAGQLRMFTIRRRQLDLDAEAARKAIDDRVGPALKDLDQQLAEKTELLRGWAEANPSAFAGAKTFDLIHGTCGWRTGMPALRLLSGWTWEKVLDFLMGHWSGTYVRTKQEVNKQLLITDREIIGDNLKEAGLKVIQDEPFFFEPKIEIQPNTKLTHDHR